MNEKYLPLAGSAIALLIALIGLYFYNRRKAIQETKIALDKDFSKVDYEDLKTDFTKFINEIRFCRIIIEENINKGRKIDAFELSKISDLINALTPVELFLKGQHYFIKEKESFIFCHGHQFILRDFIGNKAKKEADYSHEEIKAFQSFLEELKVNEELIKVELIKLLGFTKAHLRNRIQ